MKKYYIIIAFFSFTVFSACRGDEQKKLIGRWEQIPYTDPTDSVATPVKIYWVFYSGDAVTIYRDNGEVIDSLLYTYSINSSLLDIFSGVDEGQYLPAARDPRGQYWVDHFNNSQLKATKRKHLDGTTDGAYMRIELVKR